MNASQIYFVGISAVACLERLVSKITYCVEWDVLSLSLTQICWLTWTGEYDAAIVVVISDKSHRTAPVVHTFQAVSTKEVRHDRRTQRRRLERNIGGWIYPLPSPLLTLSSPLFPSPSI